MEGNLSSGNMNLGCSSYGALDLQSPHHQHHQSLFRQNSIIPENALLTIGNSYDFSKGEKVKSSASEEDDGDVDRRKGATPWHRVKWADKMVRLLITAVSYIGEDCNENGNNFRKKSLNLQKKGKWKSISRVISERGYTVSPQQCEDKFNDLNKRYKRLNEILGRGTSCQVVERPELLEIVPNLSKKAKDEVKKILSSKQLFYEEMCSYNNKNRLKLPHDPELQRSLRQAPRTRDEHEYNDFFEDDHDEYKERNAKKSRNSLSFSEQEMNIEIRMLRFEEERLRIQGEMMDLERERFKWERDCRKGDRELEIMRDENKKMKLENELMEMELKRKELEMGINKS